MARKPLICLFLLYLTLPLTAQDSWKLAHQHAGIRVFHNSNHKEGFKKIRVECTTEGTVDKMLAILKDVPRYKDWVYNHKTGAVLKTINANEFYFYTETAMPWPVSNRDAVVRVKISKEAHSVVVSEYAEPHFIPAKPGLVRVPHSFVRWILSPAGPNKIRIVYHFEADPGGALPPWLVNSFADKGPVESFKKLAVLLKK